MRHIVILWLMGAMCAGAATIPADSNSDSDVQTAINSAVDGDEVEIPNGSVTWDDPVSISGKGILLRAATVGGVTITHGDGTSSLITMTADTTHHVEIKGINFLPGAATGRYIDVVGSGKIPRLSYCTFEVPDFQLLNAVRWQHIGGVIYENSFYSLEADGCGSGCLQLINTGATSSWTTRDTMGTNDVLGITNIYIENNRFTNIINQCVDVDNNMRAVIRNNLLSDSQITCHGADTSSDGVRHAEVYNNTFQFRASGAGFAGANYPLSLNRYIYMRGATLFFMSNAIPNITSGTWGNKPEVVLTMQNVQRDAGPYPCPELADYPVPHQIGNGHDGTTSITMPAVMWANTGTGVQTFSLSDFGSDECGNGLTTADFVKNGRDYTNEFHAGISWWKQYEYPHNLRSDLAEEGGDPEVTIAATDATATEASETTGQFTLTASEALTATVNITITGTAANGTDYTTVGATVSFAGDTTKTITITPDDDSDIEGTETVIITVDSGTGYAVGSPSSATVNITDDDVSGGVYYVDQSAGSDANNGTTTGTPWKNCPGMVGLSAHTGSGVLTAGDLVYFDRSDTWTVSNANGGGFTLEGGVHYDGTTWNPEAGGQARAIFLVNGICEAGAVRYNEDHATFETVFNGFEVDGDGNNSTGIDINGGFWVTGLTDAMKVVTNCVVHDFLANGGAGSFRYGIFISDNSSDASGWVANVLIVDTLLHDVSRDGFAMYPGNSGMISNVTVRGCEVYNTGRDTSYDQGHGLMMKGNVKNSTYEFNYSHDVDGAAAFINGPEGGGGTGPTGFTYRHNILWNTNNNGTIRFFGTGAKTGNIYGNITYTNLSGNGGLHFDGSSGTLDVRVYNNTFMGPVTIGNPSATGTLIFNNNLIYATSGQVPFTDSGPDVDGHTNNLYFRVGGGTLVSSGGGTYTSGTLATYESTGLSGDPLFVNGSSLPTGFTGSYTPNTTGLSLQSGSAARDAGLDLGSSFNTSINSVTRTAPWDIGAYEFVEIGEGEGDPGPIVQSLGIPASAAKGGRAF